MSEKQILTNVEIEKDIVDAIKNPPKELERSYKSSLFFCFIIAVILVVIEFIYPIFVAWFLLAFIVFLICSSIFYHFWKKKQINNVTINDYTITTEIVHSTSEEHYRAKYSRRAPAEQIDNYIIRFENGKTWRIPKELYRWNERLRKCDSDICQVTHRGDALIVVTKKDTGKIVVVYHTDIFEYKD